jgi:hypothetical protein
MQTLNKSQGCGRGRLGAPKAVFCGICILVTILASSCSSPEQRAQKLFDAGKYEEVLRLYPNDTLASAARCKVAEKYLSEGRYKKVIAEYSDTPSAPKARNRLAERLLSLRYYDELFEKYGDTPAAFEGKCKLAMQYLSKEQYELVVEKYGNTPAADSARKLLKAEKRDRRLGRKTERELAEAERKKAEQEREMWEKERLKACKRFPSTCLRIGMRPYDVTSLIGSPDDINRSVFSAMGEQHVHEQWVYEIGGYDSYDAVYIYFEDGILTSWQE